MQVVGTRWITCATVKSMHTAMGSVNATDKDVFGRLRRSLRGLLAFDSRVPTFEDSPRARVPPRALEQTLPNEFHRA